MKARSLFKKNKLLVALLAISVLAIVAFNLPSSTKLNIKKGSHIILIGNNLGSREMNYGFFETELHMRYPDSMLYIRNMCDGGNTPGFRPHSARPTPWAFPGAEKFQTELVKSGETEGFNDYPDEWITKHKADIIIAFFGYNESFEGPAKLENYKAELDAFIKHTLKQKYNGDSKPQLAIVSPIAFEDLSSKFDLPNGNAENKNLSLYANAMREIAAINKVLFIDAFTQSKDWFSDASSDLTIDGSQMNEIGYAKFSPFIVDEIFGATNKPAEQYRGTIQQDPHHGLFLVLKNFKPNW